MTSEAFDDLPVTQRTINAKDAAMPKTAAVTSIFDAGKKAKPVRGKGIPLPTAVEIKKSVPVPPALRDKIRRDFFGELIQKMGDGDMVELEQCHSRSLRSRAKALGIEVTIRVLDNGKHGVWRVAQVAQAEAA